jgi:hypothetical protein
MSDAYWPGIKKRKISEDENPVFDSFYFEITYFWPRGISTSFIPALIDLIATVTFNLNIFIIHSD